MTDLDPPRAAAIIDAVRRGERTVLEVAAAALRRIEEREPVVRAFAHLDPDLVRASAAVLDRERPQGPLLGLPVGVKDLIDTADAPTEYGSPIYLGHRPAVDAEIVTRLRQAGALIVGKTVTTEFALFHPGGTTNPHHRGHTPGGSSSGSAAAVAAGMVAAAVGTQTAGSVIRPAAYCGVVGFKPTFGRLPRTGVKAIGPSQDTVGIFARTVLDARIVWLALRAGESLSTGGPDAVDAARPPRLGFVRTPEWDAALPGTRTALERLADTLLDAGCAVEERALPAPFADLVAAQVTVMEVEAARCLQPEHAAHPELLSDTLTEYLDRGRAWSAEAYHSALAVAESCRTHLGAVFAGLDGLLTPSAVGEAPAGLGNTGDPVFCRGWTLLGCPALNLPLLAGPTGLPLGVQLIAASGDDERLLALGQEVTARYAGEGPVGGGQADPAG